MIVGVAMCLSHFCVMVCSWGLCVVEAESSSSSSSFFIFNLFLKFWVDAHILGKSEFAVRIFVICAYMVSGVS